MSTMFIRFFAQVTPQSAEQLFKSIDMAVKNEVKEIHLLLSSPGGSVLHGISLYNYLKAIPVSLYTYNFGSVDSIGVVLFCAGKKRYCMEHGRFLIHPVQINFQGIQQFDQKKIHEILKGIEIDQYNIIKIISDTINVPIGKVHNDMMDRLTLNPNESLQYGLIHEKKTPPIPSGASVISIGDCSPE